MKPVIRVGAPVAVAAALIVPLVVTPLDYAHGHQPHEPFHGKALSAVVSSSSTSLSTMIAMPSDYESYDPVPVHLAPTTNQEELVCKNGSELTTMYVGSEETTHG